MTLDLLIRGARVIDGAGNPWFHADVGALSVNAPAHAEVRYARWPSIAGERCEQVEEIIIDRHTQIFRRDARAFDCEMPLDESHRALRGEDVQIAPPNLFVRGAGIAGSRWCLQIEVH